MLGSCNPSTILKSEATIRKAEVMLSEFNANGEQMKQSHSNLWSARTLVESAIHPDTGEIIPAPFRMSGFLAFNGPVCVAMMLSKSTPAILFWNWVNQSQNALVNYCNRNASSPTSNMTLALSYFAAVGSALSVVVLLSQILRRRFSPEVAKSLMKFISFPSSVIASSINCYIMRRPEIEKGITLFDSNGNILAEGQTSQIAATRAVRETVLSRFLLVLPCVLLPVLIMSSPPFSSLSIRNAAMGKGITTYISVLSFGFGLPASVAIFPQVSAIEVKDLEEKFKGMTDSHSQLLHTVYYNKGL
jgi:sideroflexin-5